MVLQRVPRVVVVGGGFGGLEAAFQLRARLGERAEVELISEDDAFVFRPNAIYIPFGLEPEQLRTSIVEPTRSRGIHFIRGRVDAIDPHRRTVRVDHRYIGWDYLVVATGAAASPSDVPGLEEYAHLVGPPTAMAALGKRFERIVEESARGERSRVLFLLPPATGWPVPLYELAFMLDTWLTRAGARDAVEITFATHESAYAAPFGPRVDAFIANEFERRRIHGRRGFTPIAVEPGRVTAADGEVVRYDLLVSFPPQAGTARFDSLPVDQRGFVVTEHATRAVVGLPGAFAVGDAADFPLKQAHLAAMQGGVAAEQIAGSILLEPPRAEFDPVGMVVIDQLDQAAFVRAPLGRTGVTDETAVAVEDAQDYRVGASPLWRAGKMMMGGYVPWRYRHGAPAQSGVAWRGLEVGLGALVRTLSR